MSATEPLFEVDLKIPARPEFVGVARLSIARVASLMPFSFDEVEDIRLAVGEAATRSIDRLDTEARRQSIGLKCQGYDDQLAIELRSPLAQFPPPRAPSDEEDLGSMLVHILMDELNEEERPDEGVHVMRMVKQVTK